MRSAPKIISLNVGGQLFQTTPETLTLAGPNSILSSFSNLPLPQSSQPPPFIDRDPQLFSVFLSLLRTGNLPSKATAFHLQDLISEAHFYGLQSLFISALGTTQSQFDPFALQKSIILPLNGRDCPSAIAATPSGSVHVAYGSKITSFDWSLQRKSTILTQFPAIDSLLPISPSAAATGATDFPGLQILDLETGAVLESLNWENEARSSSTVQAIGSSPEFLFVTFESGRRNSNSIVLFDRTGSSLLPAAEIAHGEIYGPELDSAIPATKLEWISSFKLLMASGSHGGPSGLLGQIRLWDVRTCNAAWELKERHDCFSDVTAAEDLSAIFKVGVNSGELFMIDLRKLGSGDQWIPLGSSGKRRNGKKEGGGCKIQGYGRHVFCTRGGDLEMWSEVLMVGATKEDEVDESGRVFRRNWMGREKDVGGSRITHMGFAGNKMVLCRKDQRAVEVWQSSARL
ncbi:hypothetical protein ACLOJK_015506 [Asimina triloba]